VTYVKATYYVLRWRQFSDAYTISISSAPIATYTDGVAYVNTSTVNLVNGTNV